MPGVPLGKAFEESWLGLAIGSFIYSLLFADVP